MQAQLQVILNGEAREVADGTTVADLLIALGLGEARVAVERNKRIVSSPARPTERLAQGDCLEIVTFVGGG